MRKYVYLLAGLLIAGTVTASNWPAYRGDAQRTGYFSGSTVDHTKDGSSLLGEGSAGSDVGLLWRFVWPQPPQPAWPAPARGSYWQRLDSIQPRNTDDLAFHPVIAGGRVLLGSSADDRLVALDLNSGEWIWQFFADAPIRYAPVVMNQRVYFGSDDGSVRALDLASGKLLWKYRIAPQNRQIPGNGRLISAWPVRTGLVAESNAEGGLIFATAGLYPQQGSFAVALNAESGDVVWEQPLEDSPQGYLLLSDSSLVVPTGRSSPIALDRLTGKKIRTFQTVGGTFAVLSEDALFSGRGNDGTLTVTETAQAQRLVSTKASQLVVAPTLSYLIQDGTLTAIDRKKQGQLTREIRELEEKIRMHQAKLRTIQEDAPEREVLRGEMQSWGQRLAEANEALHDCVLWKQPCLQDTSLVASDTLVIAGGTNEVVGFRAADGHRLWVRPVKGRAVGLAITDSRIVVSTDLGEISVFGFNAVNTDNTIVQNLSEQVESASESVGEKGAESKIADLMDAAVRQVQAWKAQGLVNRGFAVVLGLGSGKLVEALIQETDLTVIGYELDPDKVAHLRARWADAGVYGRRITLHQIVENEVPPTDFFANGVFSERAWEGYSTPDYFKSIARRILRPEGGGLAWNRGDALERRGGLEGAGQWTHQYGNPSNTSTSGDTRIRGELDLQWFGGPGPSRMVDRHLRAPAPLSGGGRLFVPGENSLIAVDAYNGTELWERELPKSQRYSMPYDAGYFSLASNHLAVAVQDACWLLDVSDGQVVHRHSLFDVLGSVHSSAGSAANHSVDPQWHWGYVALHSDGLFGSFQKSTASRTDASYERIDVDYNNQQPLVTGLGLFRADPISGELQWKYEGGVILNSTITLKGDRMYFVEAQGSSLKEHPTGRIGLPTFLAGEPRLIALDAENGKRIWEQELSETQLMSQNILYLLAPADRLVLLSSRLDKQNDSLYQVDCLDAATGESRWSATHPKGAAGHFTHGEQMHHPVVLGDWLVCEPALYRLSTGERVQIGNNPVDKDNPWKLVRPGHSCGTLSGAGDCLFFRANHPTVFDLRANLEEGTPPRALAPSRTGCWINVIPAGGLVMIPEASAGCVCNYSLQTSMAFLPRP
jgi:outer membrane protein assembly factor BamB